MCYDIISEERVSAHIHFSLSCKLRRHCPIEWVVPFLRYKKIPTRPKDYREQERQTMAIQRPDRDGTHRRQFELNKKRIYATQTICGICGKPVDMDAKYPEPLSKCIDHIIPIAKGGHPSDIDNLQLAHWWCNRQKSDKLFNVKVEVQQKEITNRDLPHSIDWYTYKAK